MFVSHDWAGTSTSKASKLKTRGRLEVHGGHEPDERDEETTHASESSNEYFILVFPALGYIASFKPLPVLREPFALVVVESKLQ